MIKRRVTSILLLCFLFSGLFASEKGARIGKQVTFKTTDGFTISGLFLPPSGQNSKMLIMLHGLGSNQEEWQSFMKRIVQYGAGLLSFDMRGHGDSTTKNGKEKVTYETFGMDAKGSDWDKMVDDLAIAVEMLVKEKGIKKSKIVLLGASLGANICFSYAARDKDIKQIVMLSPGLNYAGITTLDKTPAFMDRYILIAASPNDTFAFSEFQAYCRQTAP